MNLGLRGADDCSSGQLRIRINTTFFSSLCLEFRLMCFHAFVCWDKKYRVMNFKLFVKVQTIVLEFCLVQILSKCGPSQLPNLIQILSYLPKCHRRIVTGITHHGLITQNNKKDLHFQHGVAAIDILSFSHGFLSFTFSFHSFPVFGALYDDKWTECKRIYITMYL